ncbi:uncharacterized protein BXZ73DRAFT_82497 [Epithele typhae]|uniref:uncharacterized protein n=1 Tax=Epithele typhae TaxID=378194 RepID=UPI0020075C20|nr:uncharacterized protein BXZ73DRAFT_82497 [Epithele typhae]KAH9912105.1 hypothetical protein BXZ73DRAFT_82497 [Epithele typhae]
MAALSIDVQPAPRSPSRAGHRPPLQRSSPFLPLRPDLAPLHTLDLPPLDSPNSDCGSSPSSSCSSDSDEDIKVHLAPLCPPSPPSPTSPSEDALWSSPPASEGEEESDLDVDWDARHGECALPSLFSPPSTTQQIHPWPPTPPPPMEEHHPHAHYGWSNHALSNLKAMLWYRRHYAWWVYDETLRHYASSPSSSSSSSPMSSFPSTPSNYLPESPVLPRSRDTPWFTANGIQPPSHDHSLTRHGAHPEPRWQCFDPRSAIFPRVGDISDLHDPYSEAIDRAFLHWPSYGLSKAVFLNDMLRRVREATSLSSWGSPTLSSIGNRAARAWTEPDSPASTYSQDATADTRAAVPVQVQGSIVVMDDEFEDNHRFATPSPSVLSPSSSLPCAVFSVPSEMSWRARWQLLVRMYPTPLPPIPQPQPRLPSMEDLSQVGPPYELTVYDAGAASEDDALELTTALEASEELAQIVVALPPPVPSTGAAPPYTALETDAPPHYDPLPPPRAPTPHPGAVGRMDVTGSSPVVRLPSSPPLRARHVKNADAVQFRVAPPPPRPDSPRFSFFVGGDGDDSDGDR